MLFYQGSGFHNQNTERVKNLPFIWLNWILLEMHWNINMFRIDFKINCKCKVMIFKIARVQNSALHRAFTMQKQKLDEERGSNERQLFLGISGSKRQHINETGFCHLKTEIFIFYFLLYLQYMYLSRVLVGEYTVGRQGLVTPQQKSQSDSKGSSNCGVD